MATSHIIVTFIAGCVPSPDVICCNGTMHRKRGNTVCCGSEAYDPSFYTCCNGILGLGSTCCGSKAYNPFFYQCCNGTVTRDFGSECCGNKAYDPSNSKCCNGTVGFGSACCGSKAYNPSFSKCCNGVVTNTRPYEIEYNYIVLHTPTSLIHNRFLEIKQLS